VPLLTSPTVTIDEAIRLYREAKASRLLVPASLPHGWEWESRQPIPGGFRITDRQSAAHE
jgi:hypothetical protein